MLFSPVYASSESGFQPGRRGDCPRTILARLPSLPRASRGAPMGYAVLPSPSLAAGPQLLLLCKLKLPINHAESTLLQVFFLKNLKPFGINTYEKQGEGSSLWLTNCSKKVSVGELPWNPNLPFSVHTSKFRIPQPLCLPLLRKHPGCGGIIPISEPLLHLSSRVCRRGICSFFSRHSSLVTRHFPSQCFFHGRGNDSANALAERWHVFLRQSLGL